MEKSHENHLINVAQPSTVDLRLFKIEELEERLEMAQLSTSAVGPNTACWIGDPGCGRGGG